MPLDPSKHTIAAVPAVVHDTVQVLVRDTVVRWRSIAEARDAVAAYRGDFNEVRPHSVLDIRTPAEFARRYAATLNSQRLAS